MTEDDKCRRRSMAPDSGMLNEGRREGANVT